jgi:beta-lactamase superfamily II metal-dependent hydrolase
MRLYLILFFWSLRIAACSQTFPAWTEGDFDIHHINTGSGNAAFFIFPDGTTMLFDAGDVDRQQRSPGLFKTAPNLPTDTISAAKTIASYIKFAKPGITNIDYCVISHFHSDHFGNAHGAYRKSTKGEYQLSGVTEVHEYLPIGTVIDRAYPEYNYPVDIAVNHFDKKSFLNYLKFVQTGVENNSIKGAQLQAGSKSQIVQKNTPAKFGTFQVRNIKANGRVWSGHEERNIDFLPGPITAKDYNENPLSLALKITYGKFDYFTGGDMTGLQGFGLPAWFDMETPVAKVVGHVEALSLNHHGIRDASNEFFLKTLSPQVIVQQSWSSNHPGEEVLYRITSPFTFSGARDIFATYVHPETAITYGRTLVDNYKSTRGHIVLRASRGGEQFSVFILDDTSLDFKLLKSFGPYESR